MQLLQWKFWRDYRVRDPIKVVDEIASLARDHGVWFFILADEEPTIHRKKFTQLCEELIRRRVPVLWGINTRFTDMHGLPKRSMSSATSRPSRPSTSISWGVCMPS